MQRSPQDIKDTLLKALDHEYNVINMPAVVEIIGILEQTPITKDVLETTRLGKYVNELRRKTSNENVAKRAKDLVRKWRNLIHPEPMTPGGNGVRVLHSLSARAGQLSPGLNTRMSQPASPSSRVSSLSPENKVSVSPGISPAISPRLQSLTSISGRLSTPVSPAEGGAGTPRPRHNLTYTPTPPEVPTPPPTRGRGRPPKNKNKHKRPLSPAHTSELVPKTSPANKRLRKESPVRVNGLCATKVPGDAVSEVPSEPKKRGRRKGSKNTRHEESNAVKEAMMSVARTPKVKTTRELLECIQQESSLDHLRNKTLSSLGVSKVEKAEKPGPSTEHIFKFLRSQKESTRHESPKESPRESPRENRKQVKVNRTVIRPPTPSSPSGSEIIDVEKVSCEESPVKPPPVAVPPSPIKPDRPETVEDILAKLPSLNRDEILWSDSECEDSDTEERIKEVTDEDVERLHCKHLEGLNGYKTDGVSISSSSDAPHGLGLPIDASCGFSEPSCSTDCNFREWHETLSRVSYNGELLHILPYVIID